MKRKVIILTLIGFVITALVYLYNEGPVKQHEENKKSKERNASPIKKTNIKSDKYLSEVEPASKTSTQRQKDLAYIHQALEKENPCLIYDNEDGIESFKDILHNLESYNSAITLLIDSQKKFKSLFFFSPKSEKWEQELTKLARKGDLVALYRLTLIYAGLMTGYERHENPREAIILINKILSQHPNNFFALFLKAFIKEKLSYSENEIVSDFEFSLKMGHISPLLQDETRELFKLTKSNPIKTLLLFGILNMTSSMNGVELYNFVVKYTPLIKTDSARLIFPRISSLIQIELEDNSLEGIESIHWDPGTFFIMNEVCNIFGQKLFKRKANKLCTRRSLINQRIGKNTYKKFHMIPIKNSSHLNCPIEKFEEVSKSIFETSQSKI